MELPDEPTLLQAALMASQPQVDVERSWAFLLFCGVLESSAHDVYVQLVREKGDDVLKLADALLDYAKPRGELVDVRRLHSQRLWQYFQVGQSLAPLAVAESDDDAGTLPGNTVLGEAPTDH
jgi:hypothetical protein